jgi:hypothetical protein
VYQLFLDLEVPDHHIEFPVLSAVAREGKAMVGIGMPGPDADLAPLLDAILHTVPRPSATRRPRSRPSSRTSTPRTTSAASPSGGSCAAPSAPGARWRW